MIFSKDICCFCNNNYIREKANFSYCRECHKNYEVEIHDTYISVSFDISYKYSLLININNEYSHLTFIKNNYEDNNSYFEYKCKDLNWLYKDTIIDQLLKIIELNIFL